MTLAANLSFIYNNTLTVAGHIIPPTDKLYNVGTSSYLYNNIYANTLNAARQYIGTLNITTSLYVTYISAGSSAATGQIDGNWSLTSGSKLQATYSDLAEFYEADVHYDPGTVIVFGGDKEITESTKFMDRAVAGVISTNPAYEMNADCGGIALSLALQGRVPVKVVGTVKKGDILVTSDTPGHAIVSNEPVSGAGIGKSLQDKPTEEAGVIEAAVGRF
jgi:hypothetical protein